MVQVCYLLVFLSFFSPVLTFCPTLTNVVNNNKLSSRTKCSDRCSSTAINSLNNGFSEHSNYLQAISEKQQTPRQRRTKLSATNRIDRTRSRQKIPLRRWNLNRNGGPFGFDLNAEVWNGRVAQISFMWVFVQEMVTGKGILRSIADEDASGLTALALFIAGIMTLGGRFAIEPDAGEYTRNPFRTKWNGPPFETKSTQTSSVYQNSNQDNTPHPDEFQFKNNIVLISNVFNDARSRMPVSSASPYPIQSFNFNPGTRTIVKKNTKSPHPSGVFRFQDEYIGGNDMAARPIIRRRIMREPRANRPPWPVKSFDFPTSTKSVIKEWKATPLQQNAASNTLTMGTRANDYSFPATSTSKRKADTYQTDNSNSVRVNDPVQLESPSMVSSSPSSRVGLGNGSYLDSLSSSSFKMETSTDDRMKSYNTNEALMRSVTQQMNTMESGSSPLSGKSYLERETPQTSIPNYEASSTAQTYSTQIAPRSTSSYLESLSKPNVEEYGPAYDTSRWSFELAELWNGRFAKIAFVVVFGQELLQGKGVIQGISERDPFNIGVLVISGLSLISIMSYFVSELVQEEFPRLSFDPKPHPDDFEFKEDVVGFRNKIKQRIDRMPISSASPFPIQSFNFNPNQRTKIKIHPSGRFRFQDMYIVDQADRIGDIASIRRGREPLGNKPPWPVTSFSFPESTKSTIKEWKATPMHSTGRDQVYAGATNARNVPEAVSSFADNTYESSFPDNKNESYVEPVTTSESQYMPVESDDRFATSSPSPGWAPSSRGSYLDSLSSSTMLKAHSSNNDCRSFVNFRC